jgi:hypothetical protein
MDGELAEIRADPFPTEFFRNRKGSAGAAEEVGDEITFIGG